MRKAVDTVAGTEDRSEMLAADRTFHQALLRAAGNPALTFFADALADVLIQDLQERSERFDACDGAHLARAWLLDPRTVDSCYARPEVDEAVSVRS